MYLNDTPSDDTLSDSSNTESDDAENIIINIKYEKIFKNINTKKCSNMLIMTYCCEKKYCCVKCHDASEHHKIMIKNIVCNKCEFEQLGTLNCIICYNKLIDYYCSVCKMSEKNHKCISTNDKLCVICLEELKNLNKLKVSKCNHIFHSDCFSLLIKNNKKCPLCSTQL